MKSTKPKKRFTSEDLEKGLMLAGYLLPANVRELKEREAVEQFEKAEAEERKQTYFKRVVLAAEIAAQLRDEPTFGRVKFQKLVYLCEFAAHMNLANRYQKQTAGPFDNKFMHTIAAEFKRNKWFEVQEVVSNNIKRSKYVPLENVDGYKGYYERYFGSTDDSIQHVIQLFRKLDTARTELAATAHACILELAHKNRPVTRQELIDLFYGWSSAKSKFSENDIIGSANWLKENGLIDVEVSI